MAVQFGTFVPQGWKMDLVGIPDPADQYEAMSRAARVAEQAGFDSVWVYDHFHTVPTPTQETTFESWTSTAGLVRDTQRVRVGQMVTCTGYRNPALLAKMASTVDAMSHGRLITGIGAGWYEDEWRAYGYGFPDVPTRMRMFRDACAVIHAMWTEPRGGVRRAVLPGQGRDQLPEGRGRRRAGACGSAAAASRSRSSSWPSTPTAATSAAAIPRRSATRSRCCTATAPSSAATRRRSR